MAISVSAAQRKAGVIAKIAQIPFYGLLRGQRVYLAIVKLDEVHIDESYQRKLSQHHPVMGISLETAEAFIGVAQGLVDVVFNGDRLNVAKGELNAPDGQHRIASLVNMGQTTAPVLLYEGVTHQQEAEMYFIKNKHKRRTEGWNAFNAGLQGHRIKEKVIHAAVLAEFLTTPLEDPNDPELTSVLVLEEAYRTTKNATVGGMPLLRRFLSVLRKGWSINRRHGLQKEARNIQIQRGLLQFIRTNWHLSENQLITVLRENNACSINKQAAMLAASNKKSRAEANYVAKVLYGLFINYGGKAAA